jgi:F-type H+-transporting ATPase subunit gamma
MAGLREIKRRIKAVKATAQVTRAMQLVAASKIKHAQRSALNNRPYSQLLATFFEALDMDAISKHPWFVRRPPKVRGILVIAPDKGLCGGLISNINKEILKLPQNARYVAVGKKASQTIARLGRGLIGDFPLSDRVRHRELRAACDMMLKAYGEGAVDTFEVLYAEFISPIKQAPLLETLLPMTDFETVLKSFPKDYTAPAPLTEDRRPLKIEPGPSEIFAGLFPLYIKQELYHAALEAKASEHASRMVAMKNATDNANNLGTRLNLSYNKARQAAITNEILEIAAASAAGGQ